MTISTPSARALATLAGTGIVIAAAHLTIVKTGGYGLTTQAPIVIALALGVIAGARAVSDGSMSGRLTAGIIAAVLCGEAFNFASTLDRSVEAREDMQAPTRALHLKRSEAIAALAKLEAAAPSTPRLRLAQDALASAQAGRTSQRVRVAREEATKARAAVDEEAKNVSCKRECWRKQEVAEKADAALVAALQAASVDAKAESMAAQAEMQAAIADAAVAHDAAITAAKAVVEANPEPKSATPTADRLGIAPWFWDVLLAGLLSFGANGLAAFLLSYGATASVPKSADTGSAQTSFPALSVGTGTTARQYLASGASSTVPGSVPGRVPSWVPHVPPSGPHSSGPKGGTRKTRSEPQQRADLIAKELRDRGQVPKFHIVRSEYQRRYGLELPKVTAHRAVS